MVAIATMNHHSTHQTPPFLTLCDLRHRWHVSEMTLRRRMRDGSLPFMKLGQSVRFDPTDIERIEQSSRVTIQSTHQ